MKTLINIVIVLALLTQVSHASWLFNQISQGDDWFMGWVFAVSLETSIFIFTMYSKNKVATFFAIVSSLINLLYYWIPAGFSYKFFAMLVISPIIPMTIWYYSELINEINKRRVGRPRQK
jgi:hypothetical protein